jgi:hypothetical protein
LEDSSGTISPSTRNYLNLILESGRRMSHLVFFILFIHFWKVDSLLDFAKSSQDGANLEKKPTKLFDAVEFVHMLTLPLLQNRPIDIRNK